MKNRAKLFGIYLPIYLILLISAVTLRTVACIKYQDNFGFFSDKALINAAGISLAVGTLFFLTFIWLAKTEIKLVPTFDTPSSYVPSGILAVTHLFLARHLFSVALAMKSDAMLTKIFTVSVAILSILSAVFFTVNTFFVRRISIKRSNFALVTLVFLCCYLAYVYFDNSVPLNSTNKITDQMAYISIMLFFLYETRLSLGREKWRPYIAFGFIASILTAFSSIPAITVYALEGKVISSSIYETLLTLTFFIYITSRLFLTGKLINDKESPVVTGIITAAAHRVDELTPKPEESVAEEQADEETETDENQISIDELESSDTRDTEAYSENEEMPSE